MHIYTYVWINGYTVDYLEICVAGWINGWMDGRKNGEMDG